MRRRSDRYSVLSLRRLDTSREKAASQKVEAAHLPSADEAPALSSELSERHRDPRGTAGWLLAERILRVANGLLVSSAVARHLGPGQYGDLAVAIGTVTVFSAAAGMGADHVNVAEFCRDGNNRDRFLASAILARAGWSLAVLALLCGFLLLTRPADLLLYAIVGCSVPLTSLTIIGSRIQAEGHFRAFAVVSALALIAGAVVRVVGVLIGMRVHYFAAAMLLDALIVPAVQSAYLILTSRVAGSSFRPDWSEMRRYLALCAPTAIAAALVAFYFRIELFVVRLTLGGGAAGLWSAAMMFVTPWTMVVATILPMVNRDLSARRHDASDYEAAIVKAIRILAGLALSACAVNVTAVSLLLPHLLGSQFDAISGFIWILTLTLLPLYMGSVQEIWIAHRRTTTTVLAKVIVGVPLSSGLLFVLAPRWGLKGAALAMIISYFSTAGILNLVFDRGFARLQLRAFGVRVS
jgi:O-antigen/teichoic acid export membrane protein